MIGCRCRLGWMAGPECPHDDSPTLFELAGEPEIFDLDQEPEPDYEHETV